jgi:hypothetical protein
MFVIHAPEPLQHLLGARVAAIDGRDLDALRERAARYSGAKACKRDEWMVHLLESPELLHAAGIAVASHRVTLSLVLADGSTVTQPITASLASPAGSRFTFSHRSRLVTRAAEHVQGPDSVPLYLREPEKSFRIEALAELDVWYVQLRTNASPGEQKIDAFLNSARATLRKAKPRTIIIDLRFNGGGDLNLTRSFMQALPGLLASDGRFFALTSGRTFSAGISSLGYLEQAGGDQVTIVGEPVGDALAFWAEGQPMEQPVSKAVLLPATERHDYVTGCQESHCHGSIRRHPIRVATLQPDLAAPLTHADFRAGRDPALETVRGELERKSLAAAPSRASVRGRP